MKVNPGVCPLCRLRPTCNIKSHVIPRFLIDSIRLFVNEKGERDSKIYKVETSDESLLNQDLLSPDDVIFPVSQQYDMLIQKYLLCEICEKMLNEEIEEPYSRKGSFYNKIVHQLTCSSMIPKPKLNNKEIALLRRFWFSIYFRLIHAKDVPNISINEKSEEYEQLRQFVLEGGNLTSNFYLRVLMGTNTNVNWNIIGTFPVTDLSCMIAANHNLVFISLDGNTLFRKIFINNTQPIKVLSTKEWIEWIKDIEKATSKRLYLRKYNNHSLSK